MQGFDHYRSMSQEGVVASLPDLVVISADGLKGMGAKRDCGSFPASRKPRRAAISRCW